MAVASLTAHDEGIYWSEIANFAYTPPAFNAPDREVPVGILPRRLVWKNKNGVATRWCKNVEDMFIQFDRMYEPDRRTDRRKTDTA